MAAESTIANQIRGALAQHLKRDVGKIQPGDRLREDLGLDSLAMIELLFKIEEHFDLEIPNEDLSRITTVADVTAYVEKKLGARPAGAPAPAAPSPVVAAAPAAVKSATGGTAAKGAAVKRAPAKVSSIKAAATRRRTKAGARATPAKKKGSRRA